MVIRCYEQFFVSLITFSFFGNQFCFSNWRLQITVTGVLINIIVLLAIKKSKSMSGSFGIITKNQAVCNIIMCLIFLLVTFPLQLRYSKSTFSTFFLSSSFPRLIAHSHYFGTAVMSVYEISNLSHFLISLNRFCSLYMPHYYERVFSNSKTVLWRNMLWLSSIIFCVYFYEIVDCNFSYDPPSWTFEFKTTELCNQVSWYMDFIFNTTVMIVTLFLNLLTAKEGRKQSRRLVNAAGLQLSKVQLRREWNFVKQTFFQGLSMILSQFSYYVVAPVISDQYPILLFFVASLWAFQHAAEGGIILASNQELRSVYKKSE
ncbi:hypothetical protein CRE_09634 [Caenorhabditis remanei]|uniref:G-protein coupled receptors family 1 profile domain-containing protein n=1 Tax=Caenorhabditis remanei TaxID=31234 RepID=E3MJ30_CAERE|nr:hypothetical protein CRE_09634 [Caenorhabditis remanei]